MAHNHTRRAEVGSGITGTGEKRPPGRHRSEESRQSILRSTLKLLKQQGGFSELSIEAIAADANVGKTTVYRWWPTKAALVADAFYASADDELRFPNTGPTPIARNPAAAGRNSNTSYTRQTNATR